MSRLTPTQAAELAQASRPLGPRERFAFVGEAMRTAIKAANRAELTLADRRVFEAVLSLVCSYSRLQDHVYRDQVARAAGTSERQARRSLKKLDDLGIIVWNPRRGHGVRSLVGLPLDAPEDAEKTGQPERPISRPHPEVANGPDTTHETGLPRVRADRPRRTEENALIDREELKEDHLVGEETREDESEKFFAALDEVGSKTGQQKKNLDDTLAARIERAHAASKRTRVEVAADGKVVWHGEAQAGEQGVLADCQALVNAGLARWVG